MTRKPATIPDWSPQRPKWSREELDLLPSNTTTPPDTSLSTFLEKSSGFPRAFPLDVNRCKVLKNSVGSDILERNINSAYPILHENVLHLYAQYILYKRKNGNSIEKSVYEKMDIMQFVDRLLTKRAVSFYGKNGSFTLLTGVKGNRKWDSIGTISEKAPLLLKDCISYEEIKLSAFLSVTSYTHFLNVGDRKNFGKVAQDRKIIEDEGIIIGLIGARLVKSEVMEHEEVVINKSQNTKEKGYGRTNKATIHELMARFYDDECLDYEEAVEKKKNSTEQRYSDLRNEEIFDNFIYYKRITFSIDTLLVEANRRAADKNTTAYIHVVGIGLGVWGKFPVQNKLFMDCCGQRITDLGRFLPNISDVCFSYINHDACLNYKHGDVIPIESHPLKGIKIHVCKREPHTKLSEKGKLLVVSYAWDGNAMPGNEYWDKKLGSTGDSAAASSTQISELHNPHINAKVCAANLKIVAGGRILSVEEYVGEANAGQKRKLED